MASIDTAMNILMLIDMVMHDGTKTTTLHLQVNDKNKSHCSWRSR